MSETLSENNLETKLSSDQMGEPDLDNSEIKDNGAEDSEDLSPNKKLKLSNAVNVEKESAVLVSKGGGRPPKDKSAKRLTLLEKTTKEGEALLKDLGHKSDDDPDSTRRRTRSQTRGTPVPTATTRKTPVKTPQKDNSQSPGTAPKRRGRPPKSSVTNNNSVEGKTEVNANDKNDSNESQEKVNNNTNDTTDGNNESISDDKSEEPESNDLKTNPQESEDRDKAIDINNEESNELSNDNNNKSNSISEDTSNSAVETHLQSN